MPTNDLPAAAAEMLDLFQDALSTHVYSMDDGETPPVDCPMVASIQRVRNALGLPAMLTPWINQRDAVTIATDAGWLVEVEGDIADGEDDMIATAWAAAGSYAFSPWFTDLRVPRGAVYQWRVGSKGEGSEQLFVGCNDSSLGDGVQYRIATITPQDAAAPALPPAPFREGAIPVRMYSDADIARMSPEVQMDLRRAVAAGADTLRYGINGAEYLRDGAVLPSDAPAPPSQER